MSVTFVQRSAAKQPGGNGTITLATHNLAVAGDLQMLGVSSFASNVAATPSGTGWTQLHVRANAYSRLTIYVRVLSAGDVGAGVTITGFDYTNAELRSYRATSGEQFVVAGSGDGLVCAATTAPAQLVRCWASAQANTSGGSTKNLVAPSTVGVTVVSATANQNFPGEGPGNAFDLDQNSVWTCTAGPTGWVQAQLSSAIVATSYKISGRSGWDGRNPSAWTLQGSNDGSTWTTLDTRSGQSTAGNTLYTFTFSNSIAYSYYRFNITANQGDSSVCNLTELQLPGVGVSLPVLLNAPASTSYNWYDGGLFGDDPVTNGAAGTSTAVHTGGGEAVTPQWANVVLRTGDLTGTSLSGLVATGLNTAVTVSWDPMFGATSYEHRINGGATTEVTATSATLSGLTNGVTYTVEVRAKNATSTGNWTAVSATPNSYAYFDDFNRANAAATPGTPIQGGPYTVQLGTWGINNNALYTSVSPLEAMMTFPGLVDLDFTFTVKTVGNNGGVLFRWIDANNTWLFQFTTLQLSFHRRTAGSYQQQGNTYAQGAQAGDVFRVLAVGRTILAYRNGVEVLAAEDHYSSVATATMGYRFSGDPTVRLDDARLTPGVLPSNAGALVIPDYLMSDPAYDQAHLYKGRDTKLADQGAVA